MIINNRESNEGDNVFYIDQSGQVHEASLLSIAEQDDCHYADLILTEDGRRIDHAPYNTSPELHSWKYPLDPEERERHYKSDFYGGE